MSAADGTTRGSAAGATPAVCVIIPAFGVNEFIEDAIDSVMAQTYTDFEITVVNDGAPADETAELRAIVARYDGRLRYLERENGGQAAARNTAMRATTAPYVAFLDGDDYWAPTLLERLMAMLAADPGLALVYSDAHLFGEGPTVGRTFMGNGDDSVGAVTFESILARTVNVTMSTIVARRDAVLDAGGFDESLRYAEDFDMWLRMAFRGARMAYTREPLAYRRLRGSSLSTNSEKLEAGVVQSLDQFGRTHALSGSALAAWADALAEARSALSLTRTKLRLSDGRPRSAAAALRSVRRDDASWKLLAAEVGLRAIPTVMSVMYRCWNWMLDARVRRQSRRAARYSPPVPRPPHASRARRVEPARPAADD